MKVCKKCIIVCFSVAILTLFSSCSNEVSREEFISDFFSNQREFEIVASQFLNQDNIIGLTVGNGENLCNELNSWRSCPDYNNEWEMWSVKENRVIRVPDFKYVLLNENIAEDRYAYFSDFLKSQSFRSIRKYPGGWVEFESDKMGVRFNSSPNVSFPDGLKFNFVKRINTNWFFYEKVVQE